MLLKIAAAIAATVLLLSYLLPIALKLKEISLFVVMGIGLAMMLADLWESTKSGRD